MNRLTLIEPLEVRKGYGRMGRFLCSCGNEKITKIQSWKQNRTKSCGCLSKEPRVIKHGHAPRGKSHPLYQCWQNMRGRCNNPNHPNYASYGGRGIRICDEWTDFNNFREWALAKGWEVGLTLDRIDNDEGYSPGNCRWISHREQMSNTRATKFIEYEGRRQSASQWAKETGFSRETLLNRIKLGWSPEKILTTFPFHNGRPRKEVATHPHEWAQAHYCTVCGKFERL
jgi:hypothetical protein